ncbi:MAG: histidine kinase [Arenicellales bacterium]
MCLISILAGAYVLNLPANPFSLGMVFLSILLILLLMGSAYPFLRKLKVGWGAGVAWYGGLLIVVLAYFTSPWLMKVLPPELSLSLDQNINRIYLGGLGMFVLPIALGLEQLILTQSRVVKLVTKSEVSDLDFRIRPHFLFNSLNSVASLISIDPIRAEEGLMDLADMFRIIMTDKRKLVPFSAEYEMANKYMTLEKMRLGDRLEIEWKMDDVDDTVLLPILTLQPIIENAIYHGIETRLEGGKVSIKVRQSDQNLYITIINPRPEANKPVRKGNQIAQQNLINRFKHLFKGKGAINYVETESFYTVTIKVPRYMQHYEA